MCLRVLSEFKTSGAGWKIVRHQEYEGKVCWSPPFVSPDRSYWYDMVLVDTKSDKITGFNTKHDGYESGFHIFTTKKDAELAKEFWFCPAEEFDIVRVLYDAVVATGRQDCYGFDKNQDVIKFEQDVVVAKQMYVFKPGFWNTLKSYFTRRPLLMRK